ncbi:MAG: hypothetical protein BWY75_03655 [bacterium ADurb.Bin425]|nr:MAG: hypothetical protein BWY75_03655 [bacterium ADurb.Bin425]
MPLPTSYVPTTPETEPYSNGRMAIRLLVAANELWGIEPTSKKSANISASVFLNFIIYSLPDTAFVKDTGLTFRCLKIGLSG